MHNKLSPFFLYQFNILTGNPGRCWAAPYREDVPERGGSGVYSTAGARPQLDEDGRPLFSRKRRAISPYFRLGGSWPAQRMLFDDR